MLFYIFLISILSLAFFPKTLIHLWNYSRTNFFTSSSDFTTSFSSSQIFYSSSILFISIVFLFLCFFFFASFLLSSILVLLLLSLLFAFATLIFLALASTDFHICLNILLFLPPQFSNQSQSYIMTLLILLSIFALLSHQSQSSLYIPNNKYSSLLYTQ